MEQTLLLSLGNLVKAMLMVINYVISRLLPGLGGEELCHPSQASLHLASCAQPGQRGSTKHSRRWVAVESNADGTGGGVFAGFMP